MWVEGVGVAGRVCAVQHHTRGGARVGGRQEALAPSWVCSDLTSPDIER